MDYKEVYEQWLSNPYFDDATKEELKNIAEDDNEIKERFYMDLEFGTAGLRGIIGAGTNRMNIYVVRRATQGLANAHSPVSTTLWEWLTSSQKYCKEESISAMHGRSCASTERYNKSACILLSHSR